MALGEAEREIKSNGDRWAIAQEIPHGWRLVKTKTGGWAFSRFLSYSVQSRIVHLHAATVQYLMQTSVGERQEVMNIHAFYSEAGSGSAPMASRMLDLLNFHLGSCYVMNDVNGDKWMNLISDFSGDTMQSFAPSLGGPMEDDAEGALDQAMEFLREVEAHATIPEATHLTASGIRDLRGVVWKESDLVQPMLGGPEYEMRAQRYIALYLALSIIRIISGSYVAGDYQSDRMLLWWKRHCKKFKSLENFNVDTDVRDIALRVENNIPSEEVTALIRLTGNAGGTLAWMGSLLVYSLAAMGAVHPNRHHDTLGESMAGFFEAVHANRRNELATGDLLAYFHRMRLHPGFSDAVEAHAVVANHMLQGRGSIQTAADALAFGDGKDDGATMEILQAFAKGLRGRTPGDLFDQDSSSVNRRIQGSSILKDLVKAMGDDLLLLILGSPARVECLKELPTMTRDSACKELIAPLSFWRGAWSAEKTKEDFAWMPQW